MQATALSAVLAPRAQPVAGAQDVGRMLNKPSQTSSLRVRFLSDCPESSATSPLFFF